jgi:predicted GH43/DUF377 family glycosyl hydrolase
MGVAEYLWELIFLGGLFAVCLALLFYWLIVTRRPLSLTRLKENPVLAPIASHWWESEAVFNPAAVVDNGRVHLFYRAMGKDGISRVGYASSRDGIHFDYRSPEPIYAPAPGEIAEAVAMLRKRGLSYETITYDTAAFGSGGGWGGAEDPKVSIIGDKVYMTYVNNNGWEDIRIALVTLSLHDLRHREWNWSRPQFMSQRKERGGINNKSGIIMEQTVNGKFVIFHRIYPNISIDYRDKLEFGPDKYLVEQAIIPPRKDYWDNYKISMAAAPLEIPEGFLAIFHATDNVDWQYKVGAMILDKNDPSHVLYRSAAPILAPQTFYENDWKPGIVYPSGAVVLGDDYVRYPTQQSQSFNLSDRRQAVGVARDL